MTGNKMSKAMQADARDASSEQRANKHAEREQRKADHRAGKDHGQGCTHCDMTFGR